MFGRQNDCEEESSQDMALPQLRLPKQMPVVGGDKKEFTVSAQRLDSSCGSQRDGNAPQFKHTHPATWQPGFRKRFPWVGFIALWVVVLSSLGSIVVLVTSNKKSEHKWPHWIAPNVILAGLNNAANFAITIAVGEGIAIAWWRKALQGATVKELHHSWAFTTNLSSVLLKYKYFNTVALAALMTKFAIIDGMLYQKATSTYPGPGNPTSISLEAAAFRQFPNTASLGVDGKTVGPVGLVFSSDLQTWFGAQSGLIPSQSSYGTTLNFGKCNGDCDTSMLGVGFSMNCDESSMYVPIDYGKTGVTKYRQFYSAISSKNSTSSNSSSIRNPTASEAQSWSNLPVFSSSFTQLWPDPVKNYTRLKLDLAWADTQVISSGRDSCPGYLSTQSCELQPALLNYHISIQNNTTPAGDNTYNVFVSSNSYSDTETKATDVLELLYPFETQKPGEPTALGGIQEALQANLGSQLLLTYVGEDGWKVQQTGILAALMEQFIPTAPGGCDYSFVGPMFNILTAINTLTFLVAHDTEYLTPMPGSTNTILDQKLIGTQVGTQIYYKSHFPYLFAALASTLVCILCILPSYWGFWELGRHVSLGPFEIANAFRAPVFEPVPGGAGHVREVLKAVGRQKVQYGDVVDDGRGGKKIAFS